MPTAGEKKLAPAPAALAREGAAGAGGTVPMPWYRRALPFSIAVALVVFVVGRTDLGAVRESLSQVDVAAFFAFAAVFVAALLVADSFATLVVYRRVLGRIRFRDLLVVRGASYLPSILNHHLGQAFVTVFLARSHRVALSRVAGGTLVVYASWAACLLVLGGGAVVANGLALNWLLPFVGAGGAYLVLLAVRPRRLLAVGFLQPLFEAGLSGHLGAALARAPHAVVLFAGTWLSFRFFDVAVPPGAALSYVPILMVAATLPITPQGFGTRDLLASAFFLPFAMGDSDVEKRAAIAAATLSWGAVLTGIEAAIGLLLLSRATRLLSAGKR